MLNDSDSPRPTALRLWGTPLINEGGKGVYELPGEQGGAKLFGLPPPHCASLVGPPLINEGGKGRTVSARRTGI